MGAKQENMQPKLMVIDSNSVMHRAFHAIPPMNSPDGAPTNAIYGFLNMLLRILEDEKPDYVLAAFDTAAATQRHITYPDYKGKRPPTADDLRSQFSLIREILPQMGICVGRKDGYEADDLLGIFSRRGEAAGCQVRLLTGDRDALQLVDPDTQVILMKKGVSETICYDEAEIQNQYGITPTQLIDVKGLMGDASDNIPGVPGVGEKTALKLITQYGSLENTLLHAEEVSGPKLRQNLQTYADQAHMSKEIGTIVTDVSADIDIQVADCAFSPDTLAEAAPILLSLGMRNLVKRLPDGEALSETLQAKKLPDWEKIRIITENDWNQELPNILSAEKLSYSAQDDFWSFSDGQKVWLMPVKADLLQEGWNKAELLEKTCILVSGAQEKWFYDLKTWMHRYDALHTTIENATFDAMIAAYLLEAGQSGQSNEKILSEKVLGVTELHAGTLFALCEELLAQIDKQELKYVFEEIEMPLISVLHDMEETGFLVDRDVLQELGTSYEATIASLVDHIHRLSGNATFNINSPKQLGEVLFEEMKLPAPRKGKNGYATDAQTLEALTGESPVVRDVLDYRQNAKLKSTYIDGLLQAADEKGRIHTDFRQAVTSTGRLSSAEPNLQNIPVRSPLGREIRRAFIPKEGNLLLSADYSQIELRILAHLSDDDGLIQAFKNGEDIHAATAAAVAGVSIVDVTPAMRSAAKATNFGIVYGISDYGLSQQLGISRHEAMEYIEAYYARYPGVLKYMERTVEEAKKTGCARTLFGRKRDLPELRSSNYNTRSFGERAARNAPIQGTAADIIKLAMVRVEEELVQQRMKSQLILQIHDELILDVYEDEKAAIQTLVKQGMEGVADLRVPLLVDIGLGKTWYDAK